MFLCVCVFVNGHVHGLTGAVEFWNNNLTQHPFPCGPPAVRRQPQQKSGRKQPKTTATGPHWECSALQDRREKKQGQGGYDEKKEKKNWQKMKTASLKINLNGEFGLIAGRHLLLDGYLAS